MGPNDLTVSSLELTVHVGDSALMGCVFQSTEEKRVTKVDWMFSGEHVKVRGAGTSLCSGSPWRVASGWCGERENPVIRGQELAL